MRHFTSIIILSILLSCNSNSDKKINNIEKENKELQKQINDSNKKIDSLINSKNINENKVPNSNGLNLFKDNSATQTNNKTVYAFIHAVTEEPYLVLNPNYNPELWNDFNNPTDPKTIAYMKYNLKYKIYNTTSEIKKITNYNEEKKYRYINEIKKEVKYNLYISDLNFSGSVLSKTGVQNVFTESKSKIKSINCKTYSSYKKASNARDEITE